jgi:hypothetical protein
MKLAEARSVTEITEGVGHKNSADPRGDHGFGLPQLCTGRAFSPKSELSFQNGNCFMSLNVRPKAHASFPAYFLHPLTVLGHFLWLKKHGRSGERLD